jgi:lysozyme family protein
MAEFSIAVVYLLKNEAGFQAHPNDRGNYDYQGNLIGTNHGISAKVARDHGYLGRMEDLSEEIAATIYQASYWPGLDAIESQAVATKLLDIRAQFGVGTANRMAQQAANRFEGINLSEDGRLGPLSVEAINSIDQGSYLEELVDVIAARYRADVEAHPGDEVFLAGWMKRAAKLPELVFEKVQEIATDNPGTSVSLLIGLLLVGYFMGRK